MYDRVYTRIDTTRKYVDEMLLQNSDLEERRTGYVHLYGVGLAAAMISLKRGHTKEYAELAEMAGILHDYLRFQKIDVPDHAHEGEPIVRKLLVEMDITSIEETEMICSAVYNHSEKHNVHSEFDEIIKDADVMHHWLRNPMEPIYREQERINKLCAEFGFDKFVMTNYQA